MNILKKFMAVTALSLSSIAAQAQFISADLNVTGDNKMFTDTDTNITWLKLSQTMGDNMYGMQRSIKDINNDFYGLRLPTFAEYQTLITNVFPDYTAQLSSESVTIGSSDKRWDNLMGVETGSYAWVMDGPNYLRLGGARGGQLRSNFQYNYINHSLYHYGSTTVGILLVRDDSIKESKEESQAEVPAPASLGLLALAITGFGFRRKN